MSEIAGLAMRPATDADGPFLAELYASTRADEVAGFGWPPEMQQAFVAQQHAAQRAQYAAAYPEADHLIVERAGCAIGRVLLSTGDGDLLLVDIALLPEDRGQGLGTALLRDIIAAAASERRPVHLHVEKSNPARRLYARLGFGLAEDRGIYDFMVRPAGVAPGA